MKNPESQKRERLVLKKETKKRGNRERGKESGEGGRDDRELKNFFRSCFQFVAWHGRHKLLQVTFSKIKRRGREYNIRGDGQKLRRHFNYNNSFCCMSKNAMFSRVQYEIV